jgi:predicted DNA binding CopG/RHH family protein
LQVAPYIEALLADLQAIAATGDESSAQAGARLAQALRSSLGLRLLEALSDAALELSSQIADGHVEVRLVGQDPNLVYVEEEHAATAAETGDDASARITLRLPEPLKARIEEAASREGVSVNTWLVRALNRAVSGGVRRSGVGSRITGYTRS